MNVPRQHSQSCPIIILSCPDFCVTSAASFRISFTAWQIALDISKGFLQTEGSFSLHHVARPHEPTSVREILPLNSQLIPNLYGMFGRDIEIQTNCIQSANVRRTITPSRIFKLLPRRIQWQRSKCDE